MSTYGLWDPPARALDVEPWQIDLVANELEKLKPGSTAKIGREQIREAIASQHLSFPKYVFTLHRSPFHIIYSKFCIREFLIERTSRLAHLGSRLFFQPAPFASEALWLVLGKDLGSVASPAHYFLSQR